MIDGVAPYRAMRDSGISWLGTVPEHWEIRRLKYVLRERDARSETGAEQLLRVSQYTGVTERRTSDGASHETSGRAESLIGYKQVEPDELVVNIMLAWNGSLGVSRYWGIASPAYCVYRFGSGTQSWYFHYLLRSAVYKARIKAVSTGVVDSRLRLYTDDLYRLEVPVPSLAEQAGIVRFLNHADRRIQRAVRAKQKLVALLNEQKRAVIDRAVTRGVDSTLRLRPSGIEWLGNVPQHWDVLPLKRVCALLRDGTHLPPPRQADGYRLMSVRNIIDDAFVEREDDSRISEADFNELCRSFTPQRDDVLLAIVGATLGKVAVVPEMEQFHIQRSLALLRPRSTVLNSRFLAAFLRGPAFQRALWTTVAFSAQPGIYLNTLGRFAVPVPPMREQEVIVEHLSVESERLNRAIDSTRQEISLLHEYRTGLIADVVTGKLDVREAAAQLPDEVDGPEPLDEVEIGEEGEDAEFEAALEQVEA